MKVFNRIGSQLPFTRAGITVHIIYFLPNKCIVPAVFSIKGSFPNFVQFFIPAELSPIIQTCVFCFMYRYHLFFIKYFEKKIQRFSIRNGNVFLFFTQNFYTFFYTTICLPISHITAIRITIPNKVYPIV